MPPTPKPLEPQSADAVFMVRPACFAFNPQTAGSNAFQSASLAGLGAGTGSADVNAAALREFDGLAGLLAGAGVAVLVAEDTPAPVKPDAVFPNNWVSFHRDGTVVLYPMLAANRRWERREDVLRQIAERGGFQTRRTLDLTYRERQAKFLEGTGSLVLDRVNRVAYAALSPRTDGDVLSEFARELGYEPVTFDAADAAGQPVYHTNVLMALGSRFAVLCGAAIRSPAERAGVTEKLIAGGHEVIDISIGQMQQFAGNLLELQTAAGPVIALSATAWRSLEPAQRRVLESHGRVLEAGIPVIERLGGGSVRCMLAEIHLPKSLP